MRMIVRFLVIPLFLFFCSGAALADCARVKSDMKALNAQALRDIAALRARLPSIKDRSVQSKKAAADVCQRQANLDMLVVQRIGAQGQWIYECQGDFTWTGFGHVTGQNFPDFIKWQTREFKSAFEQACKVIPALVQ